MHHDKKVGLGLGILLVGIVGAFFFREEPGAREPLPELLTAERLDREISDSLVDKQKSYTDLAQYEQRYRPAVDLQGIEAIEPDQFPSGVAVRSKTVFDEEFEFLNEPAAPTIGQPKVTVEPEVSGLADNRGQQSGPNGTNRQDQAVSDASTPTELPSETRMFTADLTSPKEASAQPFAADEPLSTDETRRDRMPASEQDRSESSPEPNIYVVQQGDTLSGISSRLLGRRTYFQEIFELNRDQLSSPDDLRPGMRLKIPTLQESNQPSKVTAIEPAESAITDGSPPDTDVINPRPLKRDRRVIVPRRVRLNEPVANNPENSRPSEPRARFKLSPPSEEPNENLPTLEGLEPLDLPR